MHKKLFIPGPVEVRKDVLEKMATPMIGHRSKEASELQRDISDKMRKVFNRRNFAFNFIGNRAFRRSYKV